MTANQDHTGSARLLNGELGSIGNYLSNDPSFATKAVHAGQDPRQWETQCIAMPISMSTTYRQDGPAENKGYDYGRTINPTRKTLEQCIAELDCAKYALCFGSGMATTVTLTNMLSSGDHVVSIDDVYGGTFRYLTKVASRQGITTTFVDARDTDEVVKAIGPKTKMIWLETPSNPTMKVVDIRRVCQLAKKAKPDVMVVVDNTFLTSYFQRPLTLMADIVVYSLTKYMNGHADVIMGAAATNDEKIYKDLKFLQNSLGGIPSPFDCYLVCRSLKTLALRMEQHQINGLAVAKMLESHPAVERVLYPGLPSHPQHELSKRQTYGQGGMVSFYVRGGFEETRSFMKNLKLFFIAESLGGFDSLANHPVTMTHASVDPEIRAKNGISDNLVRLSVGIEGTQDILNDLDQALRNVKKPSFK